MFRGRAAHDVDLVVVDERFGTLNRFRKKILALGCVNYSGMCEVILKPNKPELFHDTGPPAYSDSVGTAKKCHCSQGVTLSNTMYRDRQKVCKSC